MEGKKVRATALGLIGIVRAVAFDSTAHRFWFLVELNKGKILHNWPASECEVIYE